MGYKINWQAIIDEYRTNPNDTVKKFLTMHPIDWSLFTDASIDRDHCIIAKEFARQQGWNCDFPAYIVDRIIEHVIAADPSTPEVALLGIIPADYWCSRSSSNPDYPLQVAILTNPNTTEKVLHTMCICFRYDFHCENDCEVFRYVFENPHITNKVLDEIAERAYDYTASEAYQLMPYAPEYLLEKLFEKLSAKDYPVFADLSDLAEAPNVSQQLLERIAGYVLSADEASIPYDWYEMLCAIDSLLANSKTPKEFENKLKELKATLEEEV